MNWNKWMRQVHRWLSIVFTGAVIVNGIMVARGKYTNLGGFTALFLLALLLLTGLYLFVLPYAARWRSGGPATEVSTKRSAADERRSKTTTWRDSSAAFPGLE